MKKNNNFVLSQFLAIHCLIKHPKADSGKRKRGDLNEMANVVKDGIRNVIFTCNNIQERI